ncbi:MULTISPECIES: hypothetical protein [Acidobacterium]|nr:MULTISPECIES: hypothetical protein [Acidobacterium]
MTDEQIVSARGSLFGCTVYVEGMEIDCPLCGTHVATGQRHRCEKQRTEAARHLTPKLQVKAAEPRARLDYYEYLRKSGKPCWFIREGFQGPALSDICASPKSAWRDAAERLKASFGNNKTPTALQLRSPEGGVA